MNIAGIDIGLSKPTVIAFTNAREKVHRFVSVTGDAADVLSVIPPTVDLIAWERPYLNHNAEVFKRMSEFTAGLKIAAKVARIETAEITPAHWQEVIKKAFGLTSKPAGMTAQMWEDHKMRKFQKYLSGFVVTQFSDNWTTRKDEIAAACIALHAMRRAKHQQNIGVWK